MTSSTTQPDAPYVLRDHAAGIVTLKLNRGDKFNPLSEEMMTALQTELDTIAADPSVRVVVLAATGRAFCAGHGRAFDLYLGAVWRGLGVLVV